MTIDSGTHVKLGPDVVCREVGDSFALLDTASGVYYSVDGAADTCMRMMGEGATIADVAAAVAAEYQVEESEALADIIELAQALRQEGLVETSAPGS